LRERQDKLDVWWNYYSGNQPLPQGPKGSTQAYEDFQRKARTNFCAPVVDASVHRMVVIGVTDKDGTSDADAWEWLQANKFDSRQKMVFRTALSLSEAYMMVGPHPKRTDSQGRPMPLITVEHPRQVITEEDPETGETAAALKSWYDSIDGVARATVFLPDRIVQYSTTVGTHVQSSRVPWTSASWESVVDRPNQYGRVPVVPFPCKPDMAEDPEPEFERIRDLQDRINMGVLNRMTAERYSAFRQKYVTGHKFRRKTDPESGLEVVEQPFKPDPGTVWASEYENAKFGESAETHLTGYLSVFQNDVQSLFVLSSTPAYYMPQGLVNVSTDTVMALDQNHVAKVLEHEATFGEALEELLEICALVAGVDRDMTGTRVRWRDPRQLNPAVIADMGVKLASIGYPLTMVAEEMGEPPQQVARLRTEQASQMLLQARQQAPQQQPTARPPSNNTAPSSQSPQRVNAATQAAANGQRPPTSGTQQ
jgi:hypothetical protein